jgi:cobalt-zinc-cadmium efflux system outer membrane protein
MLKQNLSTDEAVQIALLNNRRLQATYEDLRLTQANLVQAGLLGMPALDTQVLFPLDGGSLELGFGIVQDFLSILYRPLRREIARAQFRAAKLRVTDAVIGLATDVRATFYRAQANLQRLGFLHQVVKTTAASATAAKQLYEAGNINSLDLAREQALYHQSRLALATAEARLAPDRERLNTLMGLWGEDTQWTIAPRLPEVPDRSARMAHLEQRAVEASLTLGAVRRQVEAAAAQLGFTDATALVPTLQAGAQSEREEGEWEVGPAFRLSIPLFDQGQARLTAAQSELRRAQHVYWAQAVEIRAAARAVYQRMQSARSRALYVRGVLLPLYTRIVNHTQLQYNAMQIGIFQLLVAKQQQIEAGLQYIEMLREYWLAHTALDQILSGGAADVPAAPVPQLPQGEIPTFSMPEM